MSARRCHPTSCLHSLSTALLILLLIFLNACSKPNAEPIDPTTKNSAFIIGGQNVSPEDPLSHSIVAIYNVAAGTVCTGSIISSALILTAAHCVSNDPEDMAVLFGSNLESEGLLARPVVGMLIGPMWETRQLEDFDTGDIALVRFSEGLPEGYQPIALLSDPNQLINGRVVTLAGYGMNDGRAQTGSGLLRRVDVSIASIRFSRSEILLDQTQGRGACHGDSGGPAYVRVGDQIFLWGITSRGVKDPMNDCSQFSAYTNVLPYALWINAASRHLSSTPRP